jgi:hypothetical protein
MKMLNNWTWPVVVNTAAHRLKWQSHTIEVNTHEGGVFDRRTIDRDWNSIGLPTLIDAAVFIAAMTDIQDNHTTVWIFQDDDPSDHQTFRSWPDDYSLCRFVEVDLDGSHGDVRYYAAMFRDDPVSQNRPCSSN